jgi:hypothetical protein
MSCYSSQGEMLWVLVSLCVVFCLVIVSSCVVVCTAGENICVCLSLCVVSCAAGENVCGKLKGFVAWYAHLWGYASQEKNKCKGIVVVCPAG